MLNGFLRVIVTEYLCPTSVHTCFCCDFVNARVFDILMHDPYMFYAVWLFVCYGAVPWTVTMCAACILVPSFHTRFILRSEMPSLSGRATYDHGLRNARASHTNQTVNMYADVYGCVGTCICICLCIRVRIHICACLRI